jgi:formamidopyrimidine-DNA glycosylase
MTEDYGEIVLQKILKIQSHGKHLLGYLAGDFYFHSRLMMWRRWKIFAQPPEEIDRRSSAFICG